PRNGHGPLLLWRLARLRLGLRLPLAALSPPLTFLHHSDDRRPPGLGVDELPGPHVHCRHRTEPRLRNHPTIQRRHQDKPWSPAPARRHIPSTNSDPDRAPHVRAEATIAASQTPLLSEVS